MKFLMLLIFIVGCLAASMTIPLINVALVLLGVVAVCFYRSGRKNGLVKVVAQFTSPLTLLPALGGYWFSGGSLPVLAMVAGGVVMFWSILTPRLPNESHMLDLVT